MSDKSEFLEILRHNRNCVPVGDIRVKTRCVLCGDSKRDPNKKRLYIICDPNDPSEAVKYMCFNCCEFGMLTPDMFSMITGSGSDEDMRLLKRINKMAYNSSGGVRVNKYKNDKEIHVALPPARKSKDTIRKIKYMNDRIGVGIPLKDYERLKLIFSIKEFLHINRIPLLKKYESMIDSLEQNYIGWLSAKNEYIILRDITGTSKYRYVKFNIFGMESNAHSFFTIKNGINTISQNPIRIVVAEGPFDILSIVYNMYGGIAEDTIFMSTNHGAFYNPLLYYINKGLVGSNVYIDIYRDSDSIIDYKLLKSQMKLYTKNFAVYRNAIGKDFGVPKDQFVVEREI